MADASDRDHHPPHHARRRAPRLRVVALRGSPRHGGHRRRRCVPPCVDRSRVPYVVLGAGYAVLSIAMFVIGGRRQVAVERSLQEGDYRVLPGEHVFGFSAAGALLALGTLVAVIVNL